MRSLKSLLGPALLTLVALFSILGTLGMIHDMYTRGTKNSPQRITVVSATPASSPVPETALDLSMASAQASIQRGVEAIVRDQLKDPDSAQFRNYRYVLAQDVICGEVNAKNSYGGYVGYRRYVYAVGIKDLTIESTEGSDGFNDYWAKIGCN